MFVRLFVHVFVCLFVCLCFVCFPVRVDVLPVCVCVCAGSFGMCVCVCVCVCVHRALQRRLIEWISASRPVPLDGQHCEHLPPGALRLQRAAPSACARPGMKPVCIASCASLWRGVDIYIYIIYLDILVVHNFCRFMKQRNKSALCAKLGGFFKNCRFRKATWKTAGSSVH